MGELRRLEGKDPYGHDLYKDDANGKVVGVGAFGEIYDPMDYGTPMSGSVLRGNGGSHVGGGGYGCAFDIVFTMCIVGAVVIYFNWNSFVMLLCLAAVGFVAVVFLYVLFIYLKTVWRYWPGFHIRKYGLDPVGTRFIIWDHHSILPYVEHALLNSRLPSWMQPKPLVVLALTVISILGIACSLALATLLSLLRLLLRSKKAPENDDPTGRDTNYLKFIRANNSFRQILSDQCHAITFSFLILFSALCLNLETYPAYLMLALIVAVCAYLWRRGSRERGVTIQLSGLLFLGPQLITILAYTPYWPLCVMLPALVAVLNIRSRLPCWQAKLALIVILGGLLAFSGCMSRSYAVSRLKKEGLNSERLVLPLGDLPFWKDFWL